MRLDFVICFTVIALDQISKLIVSSLLLPYEMFEVIPGFFRIHYILNPGAAFGIFAYQRPILIFLTVAVLVLIAANYSRLTSGVKTKSPVIYYSMVMVVGGAIGNFIDRVRFGYVVDFFDFNIYPAIFNIADVAIVVGGLVFAISFIVQNREDKTDLPKIF